MEKKGNEGIETITRTEELTGDPQFLQTILKCVDIRCRLLGLYAPTNIKVSTSTHVTPELIAARILRVEAYRLRNIEYHPLPLMESTTQ